MRYQVLNPCPIPPTGQFVQDISHKRRIADLELIQAVSASIEPAYSVSQSNRSGTRGKTTRCQLFLKKELGLSMNALFNVVALWLLATAAAHAELLPVETFFRDYEYLDVRISPDGRHIAAIIPYKGSSNIAIIDVAEQQKYILTEYRNSFVSWIQWVSNERLLFGAGHKLYSRSPFEAFVAQAIDIDGSDYETLIYSGYIAHRLPDDANHVLVSGPGSVYKLNVYNNNKSEHQDIPEGSICAIDTKGHARSCWRFADDLSVDIMYRGNESDEWESIAPIEPGEPEFIPVGVVGVSDQLYVVSRNENDNWGLYIYDSTEKAIKDQAYGRDDVDIDDVKYAGDDGRLMAVTYITDRYHIRFLDDQMQSIMSELQEAFSGWTVEVINSSDDGKRSVLHVSADTTPGAYFLFEKETGTAVRLAHLADWIDPNTMARTRPITFEARDGLTIHGYLTIPGAGDRKNLPMIVYPHGGPIGVRDVWEYQPDVQFFANRGYSVLQINFRGSGGYGLNFLMSGAREWGGKMQDDITDGVHWSINEGIADPERICIYGASYGGYAALMGLIRTPELYKCAVCYAGVTNLELLYEDLENEPDSYMKLFLNAFIGEEDDTNFLRERSPVYQADKITTPVFIAHGKLDSIADIEHAYQLRKALREHDVPYEFYIRDDEGHGFVWERNKYKLYEKLEKFFAENLGPADQQ